MTDKSGKAHKQIETRSWNTKYRGKLLIHASKKDLDWSKFDEKLIEHLIKVKFATKVGNKLVIKDLPLGAIIGSVDLIETVKSEHFFTKAEERKNGYEISDQEKAFGDYSEKRYGWLLANPVLFKNPIPAKGSLSIWNWEGDI